MNRNFFGTLRAANAARDAEWDEGGKFTVIFFANAILGEAGEACNIFKKLEREALGLKGSRATVPALGDELADVMIYADLLAHKLQIDLSAKTLPTYSQSERPAFSEIGARLGACAGRLCGVLANGKPPKALIGEIVHGLMVECKRAADIMGVDLERYIVAKFNMTSDKYNLRTRLVF